MIKIEDWPMWLQWLVAVPNAVILVSLMIWYPKTRKGWYVASCLIGCEIIFFLLVR